eukprot:TRINITY_DN2443_c0_g1_i12.p1 TRINITY_DN2443_c0_g1~~TRINITY_DN2443_c0_g1_i12.p1  ORF type:complete len:308 (-),score=-2.66 TRINITY_DN2443_c0_g1_i12:212-1135(-)
MIFQVRQRYMKKRSNFIQFVKLLVNFFPKNKSRSNFFFSSPLILESNKIPLSNTLHSKSSLVLCIPYVCRRLSYCMKQLIETLLNRYNRAFLCIQRLIANCLDISVVCVMNIYSLVPFPPPSWLIEQLQSIESSWQIAIRQQSQKSSLGSFFLFVSSSLQGQMEAPCFSGPFYTFLLFFLFHLILTAQILYYQGIDSAYPVMDAFFKRIHDNGKKYPITRDFRSFVLVVLIVLSICKLVAGIRKQVQQSLMICLQYFCCFRMQPQVTAFFFGLTALSSNAFLLYMDIILVVSCVGQNKTRKSYRRGN